MLPLDLLGVPFPRAVHVRVQMPRVRTPMIRIKACQTKGFQQRFEPQKNLVLPTPKNIGQNGTRVVIDGMPQPAWIAFAADKRPHLINFCFAGLLNVHDNLFRVQRAQQRRVHRRKQRFFLLEFTEDGVGADPEDPCGIANPTGIEAHVNNRVLDLRQAPAVAVVEEKTSRGTCGVLTQVTLGPAACFAAFDDLFALTVRTADCDKGHGPPLALGRCQDETQCAINRGLSPLLEHYRPRMYRGIGVGRASSHSPPTAFHSGKSPDLPETKVETVNWNLKGASK